MSTNHHARTAERDIRTSNDVDLIDGHAQLVATQALTHAVLALVEEQRTANLLAFIVDAREHGASGHDLVTVGEQVLARLGLTDEGA